MGIRKTLAYNGESQSDREVVVERELGDVGTDFVFENDHVKVWQLVLEPGQASSWHHHKMHYLFVINKPGTLRVEYDDGTSAEHTYKLGQVVMGDKDSIHRVINLGSDPFSNSIIELKQ